MSFEIATFEYSDLYDGIDTVKPEEVIEKFIQQYKRHLSPEYYPEEEVWFSRGRTWLAYADNTGGDKPKMVMLMGPITDELIAQIKEAVRMLYVKTCGDCGKVLSKEESLKWALCKPCRDL
jgi:hypothetical protein